MRVRRTVVLWATAGVVAIAGIAWMLRPEAVEVEWELARRGVLRVALEADAMARTRTRYMIAAPVNGRVERIALNAGDAVSPGDVVARVAPLPLDLLTLQEARARVNAADAHVVQARMASAQADRDHARARMLEAAGGLSLQQRENAALAAEARSEDLRAAEAERRAAVAALQSNRRDAPMMLIRSPLRGRVLRVPEISERVTPAGTPLLELGDPANLEIVADLLSADAVRVLPGMRVELDDWGGEGVIDARVRLVEPVATTRVSALGVDEQRVNVILDPVSKCEELGDGYQLTARIVLWEGRDVLAVPASAVFREGDTWKLFVVERGRARVRPVTLGRRSDAAVEVRSGVAAGDTVVLFPSDRVAEGSRLDLKH